MTCPTSGRSSRELCMRMITVEAEDYWMWRRMATELHDAMEWVRWQTEMDIDGSKRDEQYVAPKKRVKAINEVLRMPGSRCTHVCKSMYFCEKKPGHRGKHTCAAGGLGWSTADGFYPGKG